MSIFRSQEMALVQLFMPTEAAYFCVAEIGEQDLVEFREMNTGLAPYLRKYVHEIRRCEELERKLRFLQSEIMRFKIPIVETDENPEAPAPREIIDLEASLEKLESDLREVNRNADALVKNYLELKELRQVVCKTDELFHDADAETSRRLEVISDLSNTQGDTGSPENELRTAVQLGFVAGTIRRDRLRAFECMLFRVSRGNVYLKHTEIDPADLVDPTGAFADELDDAATAAKRKKELNESVDGMARHHVFVAFYQGPQLQSKVRKVAEAFRATLYPVPESTEERAEMQKGVQQRLEDMQTVLKQTGQHRRRVLAAAARQLRVWLVRVRKMEAIYAALNQCNVDASARCLVGEAWCAVSRLGELNEALERGTVRSGESSVPCVVSRIATRELPPTFFPTDKFTRGFQNIVDAYGVARYQEVNPALYTIITFPFLFAVMFGDAGHGAIMLALAAFLVAKERALAPKMRNANEIVQILFSGRYILLLMGVFSIYTGFLYNDIFSKSMNIFGTSWRSNYSSDTMAANSELQMNPTTADFSGWAYPFGVDPIWQLSNNQIAYTNSLKMKMSVVLGIAQMFFGVILSAFNHIYFKEHMNMFCEFIPQVIFLMFLFGYLVALIILKWVEFGPATSGTAPALLIIFINMFLFEYGSKLPQSELPWFPGQQQLQTALVIISVLCIPVMLFAKPIILIRRLKKKKQQEHDMEAQNIVENEHVNAASSSDEHEPDDEIEKVKPELKKGDDLEMATLDSDNKGDDKNGKSPHAPKPAVQHDSHESEQPQSVGDIFVYQSIHTIEYCLGCISNTASYLRLWALSLAHAQLSEVLWQKIMQIGLGMVVGSSGGPSYGVVAIWLTFYVFSCLTVAILLIMEGLSAFLHALRLHWVEFQNKFYNLEGSGYLFEPFSFRHIVQASVKHEPIE